MQLLRAWHRAGQVGRPFYNRLHQRGSAAPNFPAILAFLLSEVMCAPLEWILDPSTGRDFERFSSLRDSPCFERGRAFQKQLNMSGESCGYRRSLTVSAPSNPFLSARFRSLLRVVFLVVL